MSDLFNAHEQEQLETLARQRGFDSLREYLWALIHQDLGGQNNALSDDNDDPPETYRRVWEDASNRRSMSWEEFLRRLGD